MSIYDKNKISSDTQETLMYKVASHLIAFYKKSIFFWYFEQAYWEGWSFAIPGQLFRILGHTNKFCIGVEVSELIFIFDTYGHTYIRGYGGRMIFCWGCFTQIKDLDFFICLLSK